MATNRLYTECPSCLVEMGPDSTINTMQALLIRAAEALDDSLCPCGHEEVDAWWKARKALITEIQEVIGYANEH